MSAEDSLEIYQREKFALVWTQNKVCRQKAWQLTPPGVDPIEFEHKIGQGWEPAITLRTSRLVGAECDGTQDREILRPLLESLEAKPLLVEARRNNPDKRHLYFRRPRELKSEEDVSYRVEGGSVTGAINNYYRCAYPSGDYQTVLYDPDAPPLSEEQYQALVVWEAGCERRQMEALRSGEPLQEGSRRNTVFRLACLLFRWSLDELVVAEMCDLYQQATCEPALTFGQVLHQIRGAHRVAERKANLGADRVKNRGVALQRLSGQLQRRWTSDRELVRTLLLRWSDAEAR